MNIPTPHSTLYANEHVHCSCFYQFIWLWQKQGKGGARPSLISCWCCHDVVVVAVVKHFQIMMRLWLVKTLWAYPLILSMPLMSCPSHSCYSSDNTPETHKRSDRFCHFFSYSPTYLHKHTIVPQADTSSALFLILAGASPLLQVSSYWVWLAEQHMLFNLNRNFVWWSR